MVKQELTDATYFEGLIEISDLKEEIHKMFLKHGLWKAIKIACANDGHVPKLLNVWVSNKDYSTDPPTEPKTFGISISVKDTEMTISMPTDMFFNFSKKEFDVWFKNYKRDKEAGHLRGLLFDQFNLARRILG